MRIVVVVDPLASLDPSTDTSVGLMHAAQDRGVDVLATETRLLEAVDGRARATARRVRLAPSSPAGDHRWTVPDPWFTATGPRQVWLDEVDAVFMRTEPPVDGFAGRGVLRLGDGDPNLSSLIELCTANGARAVVVQAFLPDVSDGNKRIFLVDGEPVAAVYRYPADGDFRISNPSAGASLTARDRQICARLAPSLRALGLRMAGLDVIGPYLIEVNVTSPGALRKADALLGLTLCADLLERVLGLNVSRERGVTAKAGGSP